MIGPGPGVCVDVQRLSRTGRVGPPQIDKAAVVVATLTKPPESLGVMHVVCDNYGTHKHPRVLVSEDSSCTPMGRWGLHLPEGLGPPSSRSKENFCSQRTWM